MKIFQLLFLLLLVSSLFAKDEKQFRTDSFYLSNNPAQIKLIDNWIAPDKGRHLIGSFIAVGITTLSIKHFTGLSRSKSINFGVSLSFSLGLAKEFYDGRNDKRRFSYKDLTADLLGSILGYFVFK